MWRANDAHGSHGDGVKHLKHPVLGPISFEFSSFAVDGRPDLSMIVYNPATSVDAEKIGLLVEEKERTSEGGLLDGEQWRPDKSKSYATTTA